MTLTELMISVALSSVAAAAGLAGVTMAHSHAKSLEAFTNQVSDINEFKMDLKGIRYKSGYIVPLFTNKDANSELLTTVTGSSPTVESFGPLLLGTYSAKSTIADKTLYTGIERLVFIRAKELTTPVSFNIPSGTAVLLNSNSSNFNLPISGLPSSAVIVGRPYLLCTLNGSFIVTVTGRTASQLSLRTQGLYKISDTLSARLPVSIVTEQASLKGLDLMEVQAPTASEKAAGTTSYKLIRYDLYKSAISATSRPILANLSEAHAEFTTSVNWQSFSFSHGSSINFSFKIKPVDGIERQPIDVTMVF